MPALRWVVRGRVQGVAFRWFVVRAARRLGVRGWVKNLADGSVEVRAAGTRGALAELETELRIGPPAARVRDIERQELASDLPDGAFEVEF